jgi:formylglycine-generating enzyme required for sulfatase activity
VRSSLRARCSTTHGGDWSDRGAPQELECKAVSARSRDAVISFIGFRCCRPIAD